MTDDKKQKVAELRKQLANMTKEQKDAIAAKGLIVTVEGRVLSLHNTIMLYLQSPHNTPTVVGGYNQWLRAGKQVKKGEHGYTILFPAGNKDADGTITATHFFTGTVFDISQVSDVNKIQ